MSPDSSTDQLAAIDGPRASAADALRRALAARSIAIVGVSQDPAKIGSMVLRYLCEAGFKGRIFPIHPTATEAAGRKAYASLRDIPEPVDVALIAVPAQQALKALREAREATIGTVVCLASGFAEAGERGAVFERELQAAIAGAPYRLVGPNCQGIVVPRTGLMLNFSQMLVGAGQGPIGIVSQSGAMSGLVANRLGQRGVGTSVIVSSGNEADVSAADVIEVMADDADTKVVFAYIEQIRAAERFVAAATLLKGRKPFVVCKAGRTEAGRRAVRCHTGAIAGDEQETARLLKAAGAIRVRDSAAAVDALTALAMARRLAGNRVGVISAAGGFAVEMTDLLEGAGFSVPEFSAATQARIAQVLPFYGSARNPVDLTATVMGRPHFLKEALDAAVEEDGIDALVVVVTFSREIGFAQAVLDAAAATDKPVLLCWTGTAEQTPESLALLKSKGMPIFESPARLLTGIAALRGDSLVS